MKNTFYSGDWNLICDSCGKKIKASEAKHRWDGLIVCSKDYETRHPQDFVKAKTDNIVVPYSRPRTSDAFVVDHSAVAGQAIAGQAIAGYVEYYSDLPPTGTFNGNTL